MPTHVGDKKFRTQIYLTEKQVEVLDKKAKEMGINRSELIRRILDEKLGLNKLVF